MTLPPAGCDYLSPTDVHEIIDGLPAGTTIQLGAIHRGFICQAGARQSVCSFSPPIPGVDCDEPGGTLGGEKECAESELAMTLHGTGTLAGWNRTVTLPISFETHVGPRTPGEPVQSFDTQMFRMFGQITNPGTRRSRLRSPADRRRDRLRPAEPRPHDAPAAAGRHLGGGQLLRHHLPDRLRRQARRPRSAGMSGSTTGTIRMQIGQGVGCTHTPVDCDDGNPCTDDACDPVLGCVFTNDDTNELLATAMRARPTSAAAARASARPVAVLHAHDHPRRRSPDVPKAIPTTAPPNVVTSTLTVSGVGPYLYDVNARTFITHTSSGQLQITLRSPSGTIVSLTTQNGGTNDNVFNGTLWDDDADPGNQVPYTSPLAASTMATDTTYANLGVEATLAPEEPLAAFIGENPNGVWTLTIADVTNLDGGNLANWSVDVATLPSPPASATVVLPELRRAQDDHRRCAAPSGQLRRCGVRSGHADRPRAGDDQHHAFLEQRISTLRCGRLRGRSSRSARTTRRRLRSPTSTTGRFGTTRPTWATRFPYTVPSAASFMVTDTAIRPTWWRRRSDTRGGVRRLHRRESERHVDADDLRRRHRRRRIARRAGRSRSPRSRARRRPATSIATTTTRARTIRAIRRWAASIRTTRRPATTAISARRATSARGGICAGTPSHLRRRQRLHGRRVQPGDGACVVHDQQQPVRRRQPLHDGRHVRPDRHDVLWTRELRRRRRRPRSRRDGSRRQTPGAATPWTTSTAFSVSAPNSATTDTPTHRQRQDARQPRVRRRARHGSRVRQSLQPRVLRRRSRPGLRRRRARDQDRAPDPSPTS